MKYQVTRVKPFGVVLEPDAANEYVGSIDSEMLRDLFRSEQLIVLRGFKTFRNADAFANYCETFGAISIWPFGKVLELVEHENPEDHIFANNYVPLHWDGMYRPEVPEYQIFHCVRAPLAQHGGRTTFANTILALECAGEEMRARWSKITGNYQRKMQFYNSKTVSPIITKHPFRDYEVIRYNEPPAAEYGDFVNPPILEFTGVSAEELNAFHAELSHALRSSNCFYAHEWQTGDVVIADNFSLLHGRESYTTHTPRHLRRVHVLSNPPLKNPGLESYL